MATNILPFLFFVSFTIIELNCKLFLVKTKDGKTADKAEYSSGIQISSAGCPTILFKNFDCVYCLALKAARK